MKYRVGEWYEITDAIDGNLISLLINRISCTSERHCGYSECTGLLSFVGLDYPICPNGHFIHIKNIKQQG
jgi:hypothetical protein